MKYRIIRDFRYNIRIYTAQRKFLGILWVSYSNEQCDGHRCCSEDHSEVERFIMAKIKCSKQKFLVVKTYN